MKNTCALLAVAALSSIASASVINGDFETGVLGPSTTTYGNNNIVLPAQYIITNYNTQHGSWVDFYDHTNDHTGDTSTTNAVGYYMVVNGTDSGLGPTWAQTVTVLPNTQYELSAWFASLFSASIANIEFRVDGVVVNPAFQAPAALGVWEQRSVSFTTGNVTSIEIAIWDSNQAFSGNDYAIDDIALNVVPTPGAAALIGLGGMAALRRRRV